MPPNQIQGIICHTRFQSNPAAVAGASTGLSTYPCDGSSSRTGEFPPVSGTSMESVPVCSGTDVCAGVCGFSASTACGSSMVSTGLEIETSKGSSIRTASTIQNTYLHFRPIRLRKSRVIPVASRISSPHTRDTKKKYVSISLTPLPILVAANPVTSHFLQ